MPQGSLPYQDGTWPDYGDMIDDNGNGRTPFDIDGLGNDLPTFIASVGDEFEALPATIANNVSQEIAEHVSGQANPHPATAVTVTPAGNVTADNVQAALEQLDSSKVSAPSLNNHITDPDGAHDAGAITFTPVGTLVADDVQAALEELDTEKSDTAHAHTLDSLSDVDTTGAINGKILKHNGTSWVIGDDQTGGGGSPVNIGDLGDVDTTGASDGKGLVYNTGTWAPLDIATQAELDAHLSDTTASHAASTISFSAAGTLAATDVQAAIAEAASEAAQKASNLSDLADTATARTNLGLGTMATQAASAVSISGGTIAGIADLAVVDGGTGASTAAAARTNLDAAATSHTHPLDEISDVDAAGAVADDVLTYNGTTWVPAAGGGGGGGGGRSIRTVTASGAVSALTSDDILIIDPAGSPRTVNLPSLTSAVTANTVLTVVKNAANSTVALTLDGNGAELIVEDTTMTLIAPYESITLVPTTGRWLVI